MNANGAAFHAFRYRGDCLLYSPLSRTVMRLDEAACDVLSHLEKGGELGAGLTGQHGRSRLRSVVRELRLLQAREWIDEAGTRDASAEPGRIRRLVRGYTRWPAKGLELFLGEACNLRCVYCYAGQNEALVGGLMPREVASAAIDLAIRRSGSLRSFNLTFFGGEPLLNPAVMQFVLAQARRRSRLAGKRALFSLVTNATLVDQQVAALLSRHRVVTTVSFDGPPDVQDLMRPRVGGGPSYPATLRGARLLQAADVPVTVRATVTPACLRKSALVDFFHSLGFPQVHLTCSEGRTEGRAGYDVGAEHWPDLQAEDDLLAERVLGAAVAGDRTVHNPFGEGLNRLASGPSPALPCGVTRAVATVGTDGRLFPCHRYVGMSNFAMGDVWTGVDSRRQVQFLRDYYAVRGACLRCWARALCDLRCPWYFSRSDGGFTPPPPWRCEEAKHSAERLIWLYASLSQQAPGYLPQAAASRRRATQRQEHTERR